MIQDKPTPLPLGRLNREYIISYKKFKLLFLKTAETKVQVREKGAKNLHLLALIPHSGCTMFPAYSNSLSQIFKNIPLFFEKTKFSKNISQQKISQNSLFSHGSSRRFSPLILFRTIRFQPPINSK